MSEDRKNGCLVGWHVANGQLPAVVGRGGEGSVNFFLRRRI
ncbi:hypothetical protein C4K24_5104 [Pseudomonas chlororaphis subsp. aurantiaca]|nr:hypothetical protein C4K24_5104 [Pseudomonas chlororaphis subsp. aurantiaca]AZD50681.1 hypothetical protein C4K20_5290 [Pseudomonas chlororaphis subsp. aurantiaca]AZD62911.1 hypothetical protein C4K18_4962 [Pseudomonas chlororaphis subsp. aurantiaca]AZD69302.1 hypothetical protein C4K17_5440 [Pseudomonas chlororaphis subsp. aurantiaca]AZD81743.1 hypothetical protein C4K15_5200 [Pseudomonas chlororaphis subsp. aurantiaca]